MLQPMPGAAFERPRESAPTIDELVVADEPERWTELGFTVLDGRCQLGGLWVRLAGRAAGQGIVGWSLRAIAGTELDGLPTVRSASPAPEGVCTHANGVLAIDHIVALSPALERTVKALQAAGLQLRRIREEPTPAGAPRQAFFRLGAEILEVVQEPHDVVQRTGGPARPARFWGLAVTVEDLDRTVDGLGPRVGSIRPAVQPARRIATLRRSAGLAIPLALMSRREGDGSAGGHASGRTATI
jgi:hypothetical protein